MSTMTNETGVVDSEAKAQDTFKARIAPWLEYRQDGEDDESVPESNRPQVRITAVFAHMYVPEPRAALIGKTGRLAMIDSSDRQRTFLVKLSEPLSMDNGPIEEVWAYDVEEAAAPDFASLTLDDVPEPEEPLFAVLDGKRKVDQIDTLKKMVIDLGAERDQALQRVGTLQTALEQESTRANSIRREHEGFRDLVREVAIRVAEENRWCDNGLNEVLDELGLDPKRPPRKKFTVEVTFEVEAEYDGSDADDADSESAIENSIRRDVLERDFMDGDWTDVSVSVDMVNVTSVEDAD